MEWDDGSIRCKEDCKYYLTCPEYFPEAEPTEQQLGFWITLCGAKNNCEECPLDRVCEWVWEDPEVVKPGPDHDANVKMIQTLLTGHTA